LQEALDLSFDRLLMMMMMMMMTYKEYTQCRPREVFLTFSVQNTTEYSQVFRYCAVVNLMNSRTQFVMVSVRL
jgi:hypothetical protein